MQRSMSLEYETLELLHISAQPKPLPSERSKGLSPERQGQNLVRMCHSWF